MRRASGSWCVGVIVVAGSGPAAPAQTDLLPDIVTRTSDLYDNDIVEVGAERRLRMDNGTANAGEGALYLRGGPDQGDGTQEVIQRIFRDDGTWWERLAGEFVYHPDHSHVHFEDWSEYRLREYLPGGGVGQILSVGRKVSFCIVDYSVYDSSLPNFSWSRGFVSCTSTVQGLSVGWLDLYTKTLPDQYVDITGIPPGVYWLESVADPFDRILESDETNNAARIPVSIDLEGAEDRYEPNDTVAEVQGRALAAGNSPNVGPCDPRFVATGLTIDEELDEDLFRFYFPGTGDVSDFVRIEFAHADGDLDLFVLSDAGAVVGSSQTTSDVEYVSMAGRAPGWYLAHVVAAPGVETAYTLTIDPSSNGAPSIEVTDPPAGDTEIVYALETYEVRWSASDPESDPTWVTFYLNTQPVLDGNELRDAGTENTPGSTGAATINTADYEPGTYWVYCEVTDGGTRTGDWSAGTVTFVPPEGCAGDLDGDLDTDVLDFALFAGSYGSSVPAGTGADFDGSGDVNVFDFAVFAGDFGCVP